MGKPRKHVNYELKRGRKVVYRGTTGDLDRRLGEHTRSGKDYTHVRVIGRRKTQEGALATERKLLARYRRGHGGKNPEYNKTDHG